MSPVASVAHALDLAESEERAGRLTVARAHLEQIFGPGGSALPGRLAADPTGDSYRGYSLVARVLRNLGALGEEERLHLSALRALAPGDARGRSRALSGLAGVRFSRGELDLALVTAHDALREAEASSDALRIRICRTGLAGVLTGKGLYRDAVRYYDAALEAVPHERDAEAAFAETTIHLGRAHAATRRGRPAETVRIVEAALAAIPPACPLTAILALRLERAIARVVQGRPALAAREARAVLAATRGTEFPTVNANAHVILCHAAHRGGRRREAAKQLALALRASRWIPYQRGAIELLRLEIAVGDGDAAAYASAKERLRDLTEATGSFLWRADLSYWTGQWQQTHGDPREARLALERASRLYRTIGASGHAVNARRALRALPRATGGKASNAAGVRPDAFRSLLGEDPAFLRILREAALAAGSSAPVLIVGETGTGKELLARAIHSAGSRAPEAFVAVSCAALPEPLAEAELFGHVRGAFTGAHARRRGRFDLAHRGTLFLDELDAMSAGVQPKLLRALAQGEIQPVGAEGVHRVDVRIVAAVHDDPATLVQAGRLREDLVHRLGVFVLRLPPLRERPSDVPLLAREFLSRAADGTGAHAPELSEDAAAALAAYPFPGNARELENLMRRVVIEGVRGVVRREDLPERVRFVARDQAVVGGTLRAARDAAERGAVARALDAESGNVVAAARRLGISRESAFLLIRRFGLRGRGRARGGRTA